MNTLKIEQLSHSYSNGVQALKNVSLHINNGMFGLLGANGAGKSSLMRCIATLQKPSMGQIILNGEDGLENPQSIRKVLGYLPQEFGVYPKVSAEKLLDHIAVLKGILHRSDRKEQVEALLQQTNLYQHRKKNVYTFSGGMRQRFGIAQALLGNPQLIIVDEPTAGLDPEERNRFLNLLSEIGENVIVILSTHIVEDIRDLCTQMAILGSGQILTQGNPLQLVSSLENQVWQKTILKGDLPYYQENFQLLSSKLVAGKTQISILSEEAPELDFQLKHPTLEDFYFSTLSHAQTTVLS